jgi:hypothetical protein
MEIAKTPRNDKGRMRAGEWNAPSRVTEYAARRDKLVSDGILEMHECSCMFLF